MAEIVVRAVKLRALIVRAVKLRREAICSLHLCDVGESLGETRKKRLRFDL